MKIIFLVLFYFLFPFVIIYMCKRWPVLKKLGSIVLAYGFGLILGSSGLLPHGSEAYRMALQGRAALPDTEMRVLLDSGTISQDDSYVNSIASTQDMLVSIIVPLSFPLLLFSLNIKMAAFCQGSIYLNDSCTDLCYSYCFIRLFYL